MPAPTVRGGTLSSHFSHRDPLETCLEFRLRHGLESDLVAEEDLATRLASRIGQQHERQVFDEMVANGAGPLEIDGSDKERQIADTLAAMDAGVPLVASGMLRMGDRIAALAAGIRERFGLWDEPTFWGEPDLLRRVDEPGCGGRWGDYFYEVGDVKSARRSKLTARLQVAFYSWLLADVQGVMPLTGYVLPRPLTGGGSVTLWSPFPIAEVLPIAELFVREEYWRIANAEPSELLSTSGYATPLAAAWAEREDLLTEAPEDRDLAFLPGMRLPARRKLRRAGVSTIADLAAAEDGRLEACAGAGVTAAGLVKQRAQARVRLTGRPRWKSEDASDLRAVVLKATGCPDRPEVGIDSLDDDLVVVHFDMESDPFAGLEYLFGYRVEDSSGTAMDDPVFVWAESADADGECAAFERFLDAMDALRGRYGKIAVLHYASYEPSHLRALAERYPGSANAERVERLCIEMVDCFKVLSTALWLPFDGYSIKDVAPGLEHLPAPGGPGRGHAWLQIADARDLTEALTTRGWSDDEVDAALTELAAAQRDLELAEVGELLAPSAAMSIVWHDRYRRTGHPVWRSLIEIYNGDDLEATRAVWRYVVGVAAGETAGIDPAEAIAEGGAR